MDPPFDERHSSSVIHDEQSSVHSSSSRPQQQQQQQQQAPPPPRPRSSRPRKPDAVAAHSNHSNSSHGNGNIETASTTGTNHSIKRMHQPHGMAALGPSASNLSAASTSLASSSLQQQVVSLESPLPPVVQRSLGDRSNEKRKNAALEIEALTKSLQEARNVGMIHSVITVLSKDFCTSMNSNYRKGGLVGLAATAIGLMHQTRDYLNVLLPPVLHCFDDPEARVRYYACESLYNIAKVARQGILQHFNAIFGGLTKLFADVDVDVKNGANLLDRLVKDIVTEADFFQVELFLPLLQNYIRRSNPYIRQLLLGWITLLDSIPDVQMLDYLPDYLDGLFNMLGDSNQEIRQAADSALSEFLRDLSLSKVLEFGPIISILVMQSQSKERLNRLTAITWLAELVHHPHSGGDALLPFHADILGAVLWCISDQEKEIRLVADRTNDDLLALVRATSGRFELRPLLLTLTSELLHKEDVPTKMASLRWVNMLMEKRKRDMNVFTEDLLPVLLRTLSDPSDAVVLLDLQVLSRISLAQRDALDDAEVEEEDTQEVKFHLVLNAILNLFRQDRQLLESRGSLIIRKLCVLLNAKSVYIRMADALSSFEMVDGQPATEETLQFIGTMVQTLSLILLTASELHDLRSSLARSFDDDTLLEENASVFAILFHCWCHNPVATFSLCLLARAYDLSFALVKRFSELSNVSVGFLMQMDKLVHLLESPIFLHLRLQLLDVDAPHHAPLLKSIYGVLMCLPQGRAFGILNDRLATVCHLRDQLGVTAAASASSGAEETGILSKRGLDLSKLLRRFDQVLEQHAQAQTRAQALALESDASGLQTQEIIHPNAGGGERSTHALTPTRDGSGLSTQPQRGLQVETTGAPTRITVHRSTRDRSIRGITNR